MTLPTATLRHKSVAIIDGVRVEIADSAVPVTDAVYRCDPCGRIESWEATILRDPDYVTCPVCAKPMRLIATVTKNLQLSSYAAWPFPEGKR